jgi:rare lipoprotein A
MFEPISTSIGHQKTIKNAFWTLPLGIFLLVTTLPAGALWFEAERITQNQQRFVAPVELAGRDPYLVMATESLPNYKYTHAGWVQSSTSPVTVAGVWEQPKPKAPVVRKIQEATSLRPKIAQAAEVATGGSVLVMQGEASYYSRAGCLGCNPLRIMANGQPLNDGALTMAIGADKKHLVGYRARVTSLATGKSVVVRITDTGGFYKAKYGNRVADLTIATKEAIGMRGGVGQVRVEVIK